MVPRTPTQNNYPPNGPRLPANPSGNKSYEYLTIVGSRAGGAPLVARLAFAGHSGDHGTLREVEIPSLYIGASERNELNWGCITRRYANEIHTRRYRKLTHLTPDGDYYTLRRIKNCDAQNMRHYFKKLEKSQYLSSNDNDTQAHGFTRWMASSIETMAQYVPDLKMFFGYDINNDSPDRDSTEALSRIPLAVINLDILGGAKPEATSIEYLYGESLYRADPRANSIGDAGTPGSVSATREVIVVGGTFNSPQILKLSGISPADELSKFKIHIVKDLRGIGGNLQDRYEVGVSVVASSNFTLFENCTFITTPEDPCSSAWAASNPDILAHGPYATNGIAIGLFARSSVAGPAHDLWVGGVPGLCQGCFPGMSRTVIMPSSENYFTWLVLKAHSRNNAGTVNLTSPDPRDTSRIMFCSFGEGDARRQAHADLDIKAAVEGMKVFDDIVPIVESDSLERVWPPREAWGHYTSCTCPMGADGDSMAVPD
ncbi:choline dehydrogenase [Hypoxylon sp. FL0890]|nr:choline dehydrogenase [Hypoxylon sp. FL0890]